MTDAKEGRQAVRRCDARRYHYIVGTFALCRGIGFYMGYVVPHVLGNPRDNEDCAKCHRLAEKRLKDLGLKASPAAPPPSTEGESHG